MEINANQYGLLTADGLATRSKGAQV